ncbi:hypothetical protein V494_03862 [Pseudogymnoascus sp. VKM F-4513 (FW-928)]|nr:hypothetical protein V494_03862 [Pseudogymnoascus sp. VKM F-4513 (FW-928)]
MTQIAHEPAAAPSLLNHPPGSLEGAFAVEEAVVHALTHLDDLEGHGELVERGRGLAEEGAEVDALGPKVRDVDVAQGVGDPAGELVGLGCGWGAQEGDERGVVEVAPDAEFFDVLGEGREEGKVRGVHGAAFEVEGFEGRGEDGEEVGNVGLGEELGGLGVHVEVEVEELLDRGVVRDEVDHGVAGEGLASAQVEVRQSGCLRDAGESLVRHACACDIEVGQVREAREQRLKHAGWQDGALVEGQASYGHQLGEVRRAHKCHHGGAEGAGRGSAEVEGAQLRVGEELVQDIHAELLVNVLLGQELAQVGQQVQTFQHGLLRQVLRLSALSRSHSRAGGVEVREVETAHNRAQGGVFLDMVQELAEHGRVRDGDLLVQRGERSGVQRARGQEEGHQVDVPWLQAIRRDVRDHLVNNST